MASVFNVYKTENGIVFHSAYFPTSSPIIFNDDENINIQPLYNGWYFLKGVDEITSYKVWKNGKSYYDEFKLINPELSSDKIPLRLSKDDVGYCEDYNSDGYVWTIHSEIKSLYTPIMLESEGHFEERAFVVEDCGRVHVQLDDVIQKEYLMSYEYRCENGVRPVCIDKITHWDQVHKIFTPEFAMHMRPCKLTARDTYNIIRTYIKEHIDHRHAVITSDYDFCLTVQKVVYVDEPTMERYNHISKLKQPRLSSAKGDRTHYTIFECAPKAYQSYSVVTPFTGESMRDLVNNIDIYLKQLIEAINEPHVACSHCKGNGYVKTT